MPMRLATADLRIQEARESVRQIERLIVQSWIEGKSTKHAETQRALMLEALKAMEERRALLAAEIEAAGRLPSTPAPEESSGPSLWDTVFARVGLYGVAARAIRKRRP